MTQSAKWFRCIKDSPVLTKGKLYLCEYIEHDVIILTTDKGAKLRQYIDTNGEVRPYLELVENQPD